MVLLVFISEGLLCPKLTIAHDNASYHDDSRSNFLHWYSIKSRHSHQIRGPITRRLAPFPSVSQLSRTAHLLTRVLPQRSTGEFAMRMGVGRPDRIGSNLPRQIKSANRFEEKTAVYRKTDGTFRT